MFDKLSDNLGRMFDKLRGRGVISEEDVNNAMREVRIALLEADVALPVAKDFIEKVKVKALGEEVVKSISPVQMVLKIVHDELKTMLGSEFESLNLSVAPPAVIMMAGLQGSGKTTSTAKLALRLKNKQNKKILLASLDTYRPAAQEQLAILGKTTQIDTLPIVTNEKPIEIAKRALSEAKLGGYDVLFLDTAGRLHIDNELIDEVKKVKALTNPIETILVTDSLLGQDAVNMAREFNEKLGIDSIILTRIDGDQRGGAALSMKAVTNKPIKFVGTGEKINEFEEFHPERIASRILGMGDIVTMVEKAAENVKAEDAEKLAKKIKKGQFDFDDLADQIKTMKKMGGIGSIMGMIPGLGKFKSQMEQANVDEKVFDRQLAVIQSMTKKERIEPKILNGGRKLRIAKGSGTTIQEVNRIIKQHRQMADMMKKVAGMDKKALMRSGIMDMMKGGPKPS